MTVFSASGSVCLCTGSDSPVKVDSSALSFAASTRRISAGMRSPASTSTTSPGTSSSAANRLTTPARNTTQSIFANWRSASMERVARHSVRKPIVALIAITAKMATASAKSENSIASTPAVASKTITMFLNCSARIETRCRCATACNSFRPKMRRRSRTSFSSRPRAESTTSSCSTASALLLHAGKTRSGCMVIYCEKLHVR